MIAHNRLDWSSPPGSKVPSLFGRGIAPNNLRICRDGTVHILLDGDWLSLARSFARLNKVLISTGNPAASLTQYGDYHHLICCPCGHGATIGDGRVGFDFRQWHSVRARRRHDNAGFHQSLMVFGQDGTNQHQILLTEQSDAVHFARLTRQFQGVKATSGFKNRPELANANNHGYAKVFRQRKHHYIDNPQNGATRVNPNSLAEVWRNAMVERLWISSALVTPAAVQSAFWFPVSFIERTHSFTVSNDSVFFHCQPENISELWMVPSDAAHFLEAYNDDNDLLFALSTKPEFAPAWAEVLRWLPCL